MNKAKAYLFYYSCFAAFLLALLTLFSPDRQGLFLFIFFLPVPAFLGYHLVRGFLPKTRRFRPNLLDSFSLSPAQLIWFFLGLVILSLFSLSQFSQTPASSIPAPPQSGLIFNTKTAPSPAVVSLIPWSGSAGIIVRQSATTSAQILTVVSRAGEFPVLSSTSGWTQIQLDSNTSGWIDNQYLNHPTNP